ncbi:MAG: META domain-containing protein [Endozoicomonas sp.]
MTRLIRFFLIMVAGAVLYGCSSTGKLKMVDPAQVEKKSWVFVSMNGEPVAYARVTLKFSPTTPQQGRVNGRAQCNGYFGGYQVEDNKISFTPMGATRMVCPPPLMEQESEYLGAFSELDSLNIEGSSLVLKNSTGAPVLKYALESASISGQVAPSRGQFAAGSEVIVRLVDSSRSDDPAGLVGIEHIRLGSNAATAVDYTVRYAPQRVDPNRDYEMAVRVMLHGRLLYTTTMKPFVELRSTPMK